MLDELCAELRNYFLRSDSDKHYGKFTINGGMFSPSLDFLQNGQYFRVVGSVFNDGVYQYGMCCNFHDETFDGAVWAMSVPQAVLALCDEIEAYLDSDAAKPTPYTSESFGGYSYNKASSGNGMGILGLPDELSKRLIKWRRISL